MILIISQLFYHYIVLKLVSFTVCESHLLFLSNTFICEKFVYLIYMILCFRSARPIHKPTCNYYKKNIYFIVINHSFNCNEKVFICNFYQKKIYSFCLLIIIKTQVICLAIVILCIQIVYSE